MLWFMVVCYVLHFGSSTEIVCPATKYPTLNFIMNSVRNKTSDWVTKVELSHVADQGNMGPWEVNVTQTTRRCEDTEEIHTTATFRAPFSHLDSTELYEARLRRLMPLLGYVLPSGYGIYKMYGVPSTWNEAKLRCETDKAHLIIVNSDDEAEAITNFWREYDIDDDAVAFIGVYKLEGKFVTVFNETPTHHSWIWETQDKTDGLCGGIDHNGLYKRLGCDSLHPFICEKLDEKVATNVTDITDEEAVSNVTDSTDEEAVTSVTDSTDEKAVSNVTGSAEENVTEEVKDETLADEASADETVPGWIITGEALIGDALRVAFRSGPVTDENVDEDKIEEDE